MINMGAFQILLLVLLAFTVANGFFFHLFHPHPHPRPPPNPHPHPPPNPHPHPPPNPPPCTDQNCNGGSICSNKGCVSKCSFVNCPPNYKCENGNCI